MRRLLVLPLLWLAAGCAGQVSADDNEKGAIVAPPVAEFDPAAKIIPFPNNLLLDPSTHKVNLPAQCGETANSAAALTRSELNQLDGFATSKGPDTSPSPITATFTAPVDPASLNGRVFLLRVSTGPDAQGPVDVKLVPGTTLRLESDCTTPDSVSNLAIAPAAPLEEKSTYAVVLLSGITTQTGVAFQPSATWALVRQAEEPVTVSLVGSTPVVTKNLTPFDPQNPNDLQTILGLDQLWKAHAPILRFLDAALAGVTGTSIPRDQVLLAWSFNTQTIADPFDAEVSGSPASALTSDSAPDAPTMPASALAGTGAPLTVEQFYANALPGVSCDVLGCAAIGAIYTGSALGQGPTFVSTTFQSGDDCDPTTPTPPGAWSDPLKPAKVCDQTLPFVAVVPNAAAGLVPGRAGYKTVIFAHGLGRSKEDLFVIAGALASQGIASVAIDAVDHGARAVQITVDAALGCDAGSVGAGAPCATSINATCAPQCFVPILTADLAVTRDNLRQTVLDQLKLERVLKYCGTENACGSLWVDPDHVGYLGQSLGSLIGGVTVAVSPDVKTAVFNVGGADWLQVFTDTATPEIRCPLLDALIDGGILQGQKWGVAMNPAALCLDPQEAWKLNPGFQQFVASARWMLDPVDGVNYAADYAQGGAQILLGEVLADSVVPNSATEEFGALLGLMPGAAGVASALPPSATPASALAGSHWIQYKTLAASGMFPGNSYAHGSLLAPAVIPPETMAGADGVLGTAQVQTDALAYLVTHL